MKKIIDNFPQSSFLSIEKDLGLIVDMILKNRRLKKMLYHTTRNCLEQPELSDEQSLELFEKNIKIVPRFKVDDTVLNYLVISFDQFTPNVNNPEFRDNVIEFDIICHYDQWNMKDFELRPYKIAAEIDSMFNDKHLTGIGTLEFLQADQVILPGNTYAGVCLRYKAIHGEEDKKKMPNPNREEEFIRDFNQLFNN